MSPHRVEKLRGLFIAIANSRWLALGELCLALLCGWLIFARPELQGWPLLVVLLPWGVRLAGGTPVFKQTRFDGLLILFILTAGVGVWAAYDPTASWAKFWLLAAGILVYQALAGQPVRNLEAAAGLLGGIGALISIYFLLTHNWAAAPADIGLVNRLALTWMQVRPRFAWGWLHPNLVGGLIAMVAPLLLWLFLLALRRQRWLVAVYALAAGLVAGLGLVFSARGPPGWRWARRWPSGWYGKWTRRWARWARRRQMALRGAGVVVLLFAGGAALTGRVGLVDFLGSLPGPDSTVSRLEIYANTLRLAADMPFSGGGLRAFAAQYSEYVLLIPVLFFEYAHSLYLDVTVEQGLPGLVVLLLVLAGSFWLVLTMPAQQTRQPRGLRGALLGALMVMTLHGLVDDPLYGAAGTPLLFAVPGLLAAAAGEAAEARSAISPLTRRIGLKTWTGLALLAIGCLFWQRGPLLAVWYSDLGAVEMARTGLVGFPTAGWDESTNADKYAGPAALFGRALQANPNNATAHYRLGLLALRERDFHRAQSHLEQALALDPGRHGTRKALGYCYTWLGKPDDAIRLLAGIPEAEREMEAYSGWWLEQDRPDLAARAQTLIWKLSGD